jgi:hypothetical protein
MAAEAPMVVVVSRVKEMVKAKNLRADGDLPEAVNKKVIDLINAAICRAQGNKRGTVRPYDL